MPSLNPSERKLNAVIKQWSKCTLCPAHQTARTHVFYRGACPCYLLFIGEAPGNTEDLVGQPFVGRSGKLLNILIEDSVTEFLGDFTEDSDEGLINWGIANVLCCRPLDADNAIRPPTKDEALACSPRLQATIEAANPKGIVLLGKTAASTYKMLPLTCSLPVLELQHPAYLLRKGGQHSLEYDRAVLALIGFLERIHNGEEETSNRHAQKIIRKIQARKIRRH